MPVFILKLRVSIIFVFLWMQRNLSKQLLHRTPANGSFCYYVPDTIWLIIKLPKSFGLFFRSRFSYLDMLFNSCHDVNMSGLFNSCHDVNMSGFIDFGEIVDCWVWQWQLLTFMLYPINLHIVASFVCVCVCLCVCVCVCVYVCVSTPEIQSFVLDKMEFA